jgi:hypothetical protein
MYQNGSPPADSSEDQPCLDGQDGNTHATSRAPSMVTTAHVNPYIHPLMIPQLNPLYWSYSLNLQPMVIPFAQFPLGPQVPFFMPVCPFPPAAWYYFQQSMMGIPVHIQPVPPSVTPSTAPQTPVAQSTSTCPGTSINIVTFNEMGTDNSTNVQTRKDGRLSCCCSTNMLIDFAFLVAIVHRNTGPG